MLESVRVPELTLSDSALPSFPTNLSLVSPYARIPRSGCRCGNTWSGGSLYPDSQCPTTCSGDKNATCGGTYLTEVYQTAPVQPRVNADIAARPAGWSGCYTNSDSKLFTSYNRYDGSNNVERCKATCKGLSYSWGAVENKNCGSVCVLC